MKNIIIITVIAILTFFFGYNIGIEANYQAQAQENTTVNTTILATPTPYPTPVPQVITRPLPPCNLAPHNAYHIPTMPCTYMPGYVN